MKVSVLGATGQIGSAIVAQATQRGFEVVNIVRDITKLIDSSASVRIFDLQSEDNIAKVIDDVDVVIASIGARATGNHQLVPKTAERLLKALEGTNTRLLWVGGAGSLEVASGVTLVSSPEFPEDYKPEALAQGEALNVFKNTTSSVTWTFVSPAALLYPGESEGVYRIGGDQFFTNEAGESKISITDYAIAMVDEAEKGAHLNQRISIAY